MRQLYSGKLSTLKYEMELIMIYFFHVHLFINTGLKVNLFFFSCQLLIA